MFKTFLESMYNVFHQGVSMIDSFSYEVVYSLAILIIVAWALIVLISKSFSYTTRLGKDCDKVTNYLKKLDKKAKKKTKKGEVVEAKITTENVELFSKKCFGKHCVNNVKERWDVYLNSEVGVPSDYITSEYCLAKKGVGRGISRGRILAFRYGAWITILCALGYLLFDMTNKNMISNEQINEVLVNIARSFPGLVLVIAVGLLCDLIVNWVFTLADNGAVKSFYKMTKSLDEKVDLAYGQYGYDDQYAEDQYAEDQYAEDQYAEDQYVDDAQYAEEEPVEEVYDEIPTEEVVEEEPSINDKEYQELPPYQPAAPVEEPVEEEPVEEVAPVAAAEPAKAPSKVEKIEMLTDKALKSNASKQTYMSLARMLIDLNKITTDADDKERLKVCAGKLLAKVK